MKIIDKIIDYFYDRKIKIKNIVDIKETNMGDYRAAIYAKLPLLKKYCIWSTYNKDVNYIRKSIDNIYKNETIVKKDITLASYIEHIVYYFKYGLFNVVDIICDDGDVINKSKGTFKKPVKKWYFGFGINKRVFKPFDNDSICPILYINSWSLSWKPKRDYVCFEDNPQVWICLFKFFWFGYKLTSPINETFEDSYWEQMIWYVNYCDCDLKKAEDTYFGKWDDKYIKKVEI